ncbi:putative bifunctional UDP-N-acetylglucosamine transferase and deubiquitinase ALG13 [Tyto alba]|uniref:putative bifunctional UDP-N-acetylglucosamine transferase and deubiquitinase ALG13 n=1 Tax=Tyto alba TaxID=56313 RepID=UPI001C667195|nr:putative bifunctional UDP-N-acetylglucosamine transferase and deubiquitinase ALG13 [Tyto alba]
MAPYEPYHPQNPPQRHNRGFGMPRGSARFINRHNMVGPQIAFYPSPGKRCYQSYDNFSFRSCSYSRSHRQMQCVNKECQYGFVPGNGEEPQGPEERIIFYEIEGEDAAAFPTLPVENAVRPKRATVASVQTSQEADRSDTKVLRYYFNLGLQYYHQSYWPSMVYVQPVLPPSPVEVYPAYPDPAPVLDQSVPQVYTDAGRTDVHQVPLVEAPANGNFQNAEPPPVSYGPVYYPVMSDPFSQQPLPGFDSLVPAYRYVSTWHPVNPPYGNSPQIANAVSSGPVHQVSYIASPNPHDVPQGM